MINKKLSYTLITGLSALALGACTIASSMPSGYTYSKETYKSANPRQSNKVSNEQRKYMDVTQAEQFRDTVYDLLQKLTSRVGFPPKPVYVLSPDPMTAFYSNIDNDLRESMRTLGYALSDRPEQAYIFAYSASHLYPQEDALAGAPNVELALKVFDSADPTARQLTEEVGQYYIQGADTLFIKPTYYSTLPSYTQIKAQIEGENFIVDDTSRTAAGSLNSFSTVGDKMPSEPMPMMAPPPAPMPMDNMNYQMQPGTIELIEPMMIEPTVSVEPQESMTIDSAPMTYEPATSRPRVSKAID